jgi:sugar O-acyltransferase (sialic acid O-acetyltransferase NeuD family)
MAPRVPEAQMARVVIFGCGRGADVAARYIANDSEHQVVAFAVDREYLDSPTFRGLPVVDFARIHEEFPPDQCSMFVPMGYQDMNRLRATKYSQVKAKGYRCISYVSSKIATHDQLSVGENCFILENQTIDFDVTIGNNVVVWSGCLISDLVKIGDHVWLSSHSVVASEVVIGNNAFLGLNCSILNTVRIASGSYIGAAAVITKDTEPNSVHVVEGTKAMGISSDDFLRIVTSSQKAVLGR